MLFVGVLVSGFLSVAQSAFAQTQYANPLKFDSLEEVMGSALDTMQGIIVILAIIFIIIGALLYITSSGDEGQISKAKSAITAAMIGLALGIAAPSFLKEIAQVLGWTTVDSAIAQADTLTAVSVKVLNFLLSIIGVIAIIMLVIGGMTYLTAAGDEGKAEVGKRITTYAIVGIAVALAALVIVTQIANFFA
jgi:hypothetical protein